MSSVLGTYARKSISFTHGKGSYLYTKNGDKYLDFVQGIATNILGHCHDLDSMKFKVGERQGVYMNIGFPKSHGSIVTWSDEDHELTRMPLPTLSSDITRDSNFSSTSESNSPKAKTADWKSKSTLSY